MSIAITVKDRKNDVICTMQKVEMTITVSDFKKLFLTECEMAKKRKLIPARLRFTINEASGTPLSDNTKKLSHYI